MATTSRQPATAGRAFGRAVAAALALGALAGCADAQARAQWRVVVETDAPVPQLGDRLFVEILGADGSACRGCPRVLPAGDPGAWPISFGVVPDAAASAVRLRIRLYRAARSGPDGSPEGAALIEATGRLPEVADGVAEVRVRLAMSCFGVAADDAAKASCDPATGRLAPEPELGGSGATLAPGSWSGAAVRPCPADPPAGMACIPGGAFLLGGAPSILLDAEAVPLPERLVRISPFALDTREVTVGQVRAIAGQLSSHPLVYKPGLDSPTAQCSYPQGDDSSRDALPVNCLNRNLAAEICDKLDHKRLPTEAEWEYAAGNRQRETTYAWGEEPELCERAALGLGLLQGETTFAALALTDSSCRSRPDGTLAPPGPEPGGRAADVTDDGIQDMTGNLDEWVADSFAPYDAPCWRDGPVVLDDPRCETAENAPDFRGASWRELKMMARVYHRWHGDETKLLGSIGIGLRCAKSL